jgi:Uma2 family endonuclease
METVKSPAEQRVILRNVSWKTYESLLSGRGETRVPRFIYDQGMLEVVSPSSEHESIGYYLGLLVAVFAEETGVDVYGVGSTTFKRTDVQRGFEPDACFYIQNEALVRGKARIDLDTDPPPDLVIEVDITSPSLDKLPIYGQMGVSEVWRYDGDDLSFFVLDNKEYSEVEASIVLPPITARAVFNLIEKSKSLGLASWLQEVRETVREGPS